MFAKVAELCVQHMELRNDIDVSAIFSFSDCGELLAYRGGVCAGRMQ